MLICFPTNNDTGMDAVIHGHFGSAPFFTIYNTESKDCEVIANSNSHHSHGTCHPMNQLSKFKIDAVICSGMGRRAVEALNSEGIKTLIVDATIVKEAVDQFTDGTAKDINPATACHGHGQRQHTENSDGNMRCSTDHTDHGRSGRGGNRHGSGSGFGGGRGFGGGGKGRH